MVPGEIRNTETALERLDQWLGDSKWDLIYFNFGLGDLVHRLPNSKSFRALSKTAGGIPSTEPDQYRENLNQIVARLKSTNANLVWGSTTPIRSAPKGIFVMGSEIEYNAIAAEIMAENDIPICDMYSHVKDLIDMNRPASHSGDPFSFDKKPIHEPIVDLLTEQLFAK